MAIRFEQALDALSDSEAQLGAGMVAALSHPSRQQVAAFLACLAPLGDDRRREVVARMVGSAEEQFRLDFDDLLRPLLADRDPLIRRLAIEGLWEDERPDLVDPLLRALTADSDNAVRAAAATSLGRFVFLAECEETDAAHGERIRAALERIIADPQEDLEVARRAVESVAYINDDVVRRIIDRAYADGRALMRQSALFAMGRNADASWADLVLAELAGDEPSMRYEAARASGELQLREAMVHLVRMAAERDSEVREMAIWAMGQIGGPVAHRALTRLAGSSNPSTAAAADEALAELQLADLSLDLLQVSPDQQDLVEEPADDSQWDESEMDELDDLEDEDSQDEDEADEADWPDEFLELDK